MGGRGFGLGPLSDFNERANMSRDWVPAGSVGYDVAYAEGEFTSETDDGSVPYFSTVPYKPARDPRMCTGNNNKCKGWKTGGTDLCAGHNLSRAKTEAA